jgi:hypothetical protein
MGNDFKSLDKISPLMNVQVPEFIRIDHPSFVAFLNAYYEWLETQGVTLRNSMDLAKVKDIDTTFEEYVTHFKNQYLLGFPETLAINQDTGRPVEEKTLIKHIKQYYRARGTEKTFEFLFRILYDTNVEFYYPKVDILKASDGKWIRRKTIRVSGAQGTTLFESNGRKMYQRNDAGAIVSSANIIEISRYQLGPYQIYEFELGTVNGTFYANKPLDIETSRGIVTEPKTYSVVTAVTINSGGVRYRVGDTLLFTNASGDEGFGAKGKVAQVDSTGKILRITILNFGANYEAVPSVRIVSEKGTGFSGTATIGAICSFDGYWSNNDGRLSTNKVIQDSRYYQNYSYVLKAEVVIDTYRDIIRQLIHPAGLGFFGQVLIKRCAESNLDIESALIKYEVPLIGHYVPYTNQTFDDLRVWFGGTANGYDPNIHNPILQSQPNPVTNNVAFSRGVNLLRTPNFPGADPWWIIYQHPNRRVTGNVLARIEYDLKGLSGRSSTGAGKSDFLNASTTGATSWNEWTLTGNSLRSNWATSFTGGFKYAVLKYNNRSEFRKITLGSFFNMPVGEEFRCANEWENQVYNGFGSQGLSDGTVDYLTDGLTTYSPPESLGCADPTADNYSSLVVYDDGSCTYNPIYGCTSLTAMNYNPYATDDDGSCIYPRYGCTDYNAINYDPLANIDNNSCRYGTDDFLLRGVVLGCADPSALNYNSRANRNDGTCVYADPSQGTRGCKDTFASNYSADATVRDDTMCVYSPRDGVGGCKDPSASNYNSNADYHDGSCVYEISSLQSFGCMNPAAVNYDPMSKTRDDTLCVYDSPSYRGIAGCMDTNALNYNASAEYNDGSCVYEDNTVGTRGCKNPRALNYDANATIRDDSLCIFRNTGCTDPSALNYNRNVAVDDGSCIYSFPINADITSSEDLVE